MTPIDLLRQAESLGLRIEPKGGSKLLVSPAERCTAEFAQVLRDHKHALLSWLTNPPCHRRGAVPVADLPLDPAMPTPDTENARRVMDFIVGQIGSEPCPLCEWCLRRETAYWDAHGWPDDLCAYAAARDAACWQLNRNEADIWDVLQGFKEVFKTAKK
jgi:hypothetical protein